MMKAKHTMSLLTAGALIQIITSIVWSWFSGNYNASLTWGELVAMAGQCIGEVFYFLAIRAMAEKLVDTVGVGVVCTADFLITLCCFDLISMLLENPFGDIIGKYAAFGTSAIIFAYTYDKMRVKNG